MKKIVLCLLATFMSLTFLPLQLNAITSESNSMIASKPSDPSDSTDVKVLMLRLDEIKAIDKSGLKSSEKKELRKETHSINQEIRHSHGGIYISSGAIIIVLLIIILV
jgi:hypothetical protein